MVDEGDNRMDTMVACTDDGGDVAQASILECTGPKRPLDPFLVASVRKAYQAKEGGYRKLALRFGLSRDAARRCIRSPEMSVLDGDEVAMSVPGVEAHARARLLERFGMSPTKAEWKSAYLTVREGKALLVHRKEDIRGVSETHLVQLAGRELLVVYSPRSHRIVTVLKSNQTFQRRKNRALKVQAVGLQFELSVPAPSV